MTGKMDNDRTVARLLWRGGNWDAALTALDRDDHEIRCEILLERCLFSWCEFSEARHAITTVVDPVLNTYYQARLAYCEALSSGDLQDRNLHPIREGLTAAMSHDRVKHWAAFWRGAVAEEFDDDPYKAAAAYDRAFPMARHHKDIMLESCVTRRRGLNAWKTDKEEGLRLLRRAFYLSATAGSRPQTALAAASLSHALPEGEEATDLREAARRAAKELRSPWLLEKLDGSR